MTDQTRCFVALYSGNTVAAAQIIAASADPELVALATKKMLREIDRDDPDAAKPASQGRRRALQIIQSGGGAPSVD